MVARAGRYAYMAKLDIKNAFRLCPVRKEDWWLLGLKWDKKFYVYTSLPFGSRFSPAIFNQFAGLLCWLFVEIGGIPTVTHYLDDYFFVVSTKVLSQANLESAIHLCEYLGVPLAVNKMVGPSTYLGIQLDSASLIISLPENKLINLVNMLEAWDAKLTCTKRDLLSLVGSLSFACKVVKPGRTFLRLLIDLSTTQPELQGILLLDEEARADIKWWRDSIWFWNGKEIIQPQPVTSVDLGLYTDASNVGMGGVSGNKWFCYAWVKSWGKNIST